MDLKAFQKKASGSKESNTKLFAKLKKVKPASLDIEVQNIHEAVFQNTDCLSCANCCKTTSPIFYQKDIERLSKHFRIKPSEFISKYLHEDSERDFVLNYSPCPFLDNENYCMVYDSRPNACREYPHTDRKRFYQLLNLTLKNTEICPAVLEIVERLKKIY